MHVVKQVGFNTIFRGHLYLPKSGVRNRPTLLIISMRILIEIDDTNYKTFLVLFPDLHFGIRNISQYLCNTVTKGSMPNVRSESEQCLLQ